MKRISRQKAQLIVNLVLTVFTLLALIVSVVAWFSTRQYAEIQSIHLAVNRKEMTVTPQHKSFVFPCATKLDDVSADAFNKHCIIVAKYVVTGPGKVYAEVDNDDGILGYVWDDDDAYNVYYDDEKTNPNYYQTIMKALCNYHNADDVSTLPDGWSDDNRLVTALDDINSRPAGNFVDDGDTTVTIVFWADYQSLQETLEKIQDGVYVYSFKEFSVDVTFVA